MIAEYPRQLDVRLSKEQHKILSDHSKRINKTRSELIRDFIQNLLVDSGENYKKDG